MSLAKLLSVSVLASGVVALSSASILNGSFQDGAGSSADNWTFVGSTSASTDAGYGGAGGFGTSPYGGRFLAFNGGNNPAGNSAAQEFSTILGQWYSVKFAFANFGASTLQRLNVVVTDSTAAVLGSAAYDDSTGGENMALIWAEDELLFQATTSLSTLTFSDNGSTTNGTDLLVDNASVEAVPEPLTIALLGLGVAAAAKRRRH